MVFSFNLDSVYHTFDRPLVCLLHPLLPRARTHSPSLEQHRSSRRHHPSTVSPMPSASPEIPKGNLNLITQALAAVGCEMPVIPDPTTVHYHLPDNLSVLVHREYSEFISERTSKFPHEKQGILKFYGVCWKVFNASNSLELKSLEEPIYHFGQFFQKPVECLTLAYYLPQNAGDIACKYIQDPQLLSFIDAECFIVITVKALQTPMINASMVMCDRHYGGINYPIGGVGGIEKSLAKGLVDQGSQILYKANVTNIIVDPGRVVGVRLSDGREFFAKTIISNATRWNTFGLKSSIVFKESWQVGTPKTHRRYLARDKGTYGPIPRNTPKGLLGMPFNTTAMDGLYCVGDSCFPGQGVIAVSFSGVMCAHRVAADEGLEKKSPVLDAALLRLLRWLRTLA